MQKTLIIIAIIALSIAGYAEYTAQQLYRERLEFDRQQANWSMKLDCYWLVENEARNGKHSTFNMEECDY